MTEKGIVEKLQKVIESCKSKDQLKGAYKYYKLYVNRFTEEQLSRNPQLAWLDGWCLGYFKGVLSCK